MNHSYIFLDALYATMHDRDLRMEADYARLLASAEVDSAPSGPFAVLRRVGGAIAGAIGGVTGPVGDRALAK